MRQCISLILVLFFYFSPAQKEENTVKVLLDDLIEKSQVVGVAAGYSINGTVIETAAAGYADRKAELDCNVNTKMRMASIAKPMTAVAVMQLMEKGLIDLDAPIQTYLPDYPIISTTPITSRHLLSHTSGVSGYKNGNESNTINEYATLKNAVDVFKDRELKFEPGTNYSYTSYGYTLLGLIIESITGMSFVDYMQTNVWDKAGMNSTGVDKYKVLEENESQLYIRKSDKGKPKDATENNLSNRVPGGGLYTTIPDLIAFGHAIINHKLISQESLDLMTQHHSLEKVYNSYGFGWFLYGQTPNVGSIIGHAGGQTGCTSFLFIVPSQNAVSAVLSNTSNAKFAIDPLANKLLNLSLGNPLKQ